MEFHGNLRKNESASIIQRAWRRFKSKLELKNKCAERIQNAFRRRKLKIEKRKEFKLKMFRKRKGDKTSMYPNKIRRVESLWSVDDHDFKYLNESASIIQQAWHRFKCKLEFKNKCAERIQKAFRRRKLKIKKREELKLKMCRKRKGENTSMYPDKIRRVESLWSVDDRDFKYLVKVQKLGEGGFGEMIIGEPYTYSVDWWSFGVTLFQMLIGQLPFYDDQERNMFENIVYTTPDIPDWLGTEARDCLLKQLLRKCPAVRLGVYNYHLHPFFSGKEPLAITCASSAPNATAENEINPMSGFSFLLSDEENVFMADDTSSD
ncbi:Protein kinase C delta type [Stylophora pistillata]|uniref:Protein kinase C delta type n=1 Tax=Stylophora pistillata TaxID=50429 RepID=A0A2B4SB84_STYPI|nr:Protein kinase C delta type [Stylophora pistillata]